MEPAAYLAADPQPQFKVVPLEKVLGRDWRREDFSGIGEIDLRVILRQWGGDEIAAKLAPAWRGGYYMALINKKSAKDAPVPLALVLNFATPAAANQFAAVYESALAQRYKSVQPAASPRISGTLKKAPCSSTSTARRSLPLESFTPEDAAKIHAALVPAEAIATAK